MEGPKSLQQKQKVRNGSLPGIWTLAAGRGRTRAARKKPLTQR